jgi:hypothetical protein
MNLTHEKTLKTLNKLKTFCHDMWKVHAATVFVAARVLVAANALRS